MSSFTPSRLPRHIGLIPDGNRRWAVGRGMEKQDGYEHGIEPGLQMLEICQALGIEEISIYGFTQDNTRRPAIQKQRFREACVQYASQIVDKQVALLVVGDAQSSQFPEALKPYTQRQGEGIKVNFLVNYGWQWDLNGLREGKLRSNDVSRIDLIVRWGGARRLSGFLPVQSVYADFHVVNEYWPDFQPDQFYDALRWYEKQDRTLGG